jgi:hypothetical protein
MSTSPGHLVPLPLLGLVLTLAACEPTSGRMVAFDVESQLATSGGGDPSFFANDRGWTLDLESARVATGPLYLFADASNVARKAPARPVRRMLAALWIPAAQAHPGDDFFAGGEVLGEWPDQWLLDAQVRETVEVGRAAGVEGQARSAALLLMPALPEVERAAPELTGHVAHFRGEAEKDGVRVAFDVLVPAGIDLNAQRVGGVPADLNITDDVRVRLTLLIDAVFAGVDFGALAAGEPTAESALRAALRINLHRAGTWRLDGEGGAPVDARMAP